MNESKPKSDPSREKNLRLRRTTLRRLTQAELGRVAGGDIPTHTGFGLCNTITTLEP